MTDFAEPNIPQKILCVCLGNICRSPTAEAVLRRAATAAGLDLVVDSAGTSNWHPGKAPDPRSQHHAGLRGLDLSGMLVNVQSNPLSYGLAFLGAVLWAAYCTVTARMAQGKNAITLFVTLTALTLWCKYAMAGSEPMHWSLGTGIHLAFAAAAMGLGYGAWNVGILHGNVTVLAGASYFTPVFSAALAAVLLQVPLTPAFWLGTGMVCGGAVLCWLATRSGRCLGDA